MIESLPDPVRRRGQTLVRIDAATVSHLDITIATGEFDLAPPLPYVAGCEGAGTVLESDVHPVGTQVIFRDGSLGLDRDGTWRELACVDDDTLLPLDPPLPPAVAAAFFVPVTTAHVALFDIGGLTPGQKVLVTGATGAVGSMAVQLARDAGAEVIGLVSRTERLHRLPRGIHGVSLDDPRAVASLESDRDLDLLVDTIGGPGLGDRIRWIAAGGTLACLGYAAGTRFEVDLPGWFYSDVSLLPVNLLRRTTRAETIARSLLPRIADGALEVAIEEFALENIADALRALETGSLTGRAVIRLT
ncbi:quinone oxidoreductase family protein [Gordonia sp. NPDC003376]